MFWRSDSSASIFHFSTLFRMMMDAYFIVPIAAVMASESGLSRFANTMTG